MKKQFQCIVFLLLLTSTLWAQSELADTIYTRNGSIILCKVKEIGTSEIKYLQPDINPDVLYSIEIRQVEKISFNNGKVQTFDYRPSAGETIEQNSEYLFETQRRKALKIDFLALTTSSLTLTYEQCLKPGGSIEFSAGYIGISPGINDENPSGILLRAGYKFMRNPDYYLKGMRYTHILKGPYLKMELDFASYSVDAYSTIYGHQDKLNNTKYAILVVFGNQWVFQDKFLIDLYSGMGIGGNNLKNDESTYPYGFAVLPDEIPFAFSFGLRIGLLLK